MKTATYEGVEYAPGKKFRVVMTGGRLSGWEPKLGYQQGWGQVLEPGDEIVCAGAGWGMGSDPGYGVHWRVEGKNYVEFVPSTGGAFGYRPAPGFLEPIDEEQ